MHPFSLTEPNAQSAASSEPTEPTELTDEDTNGVVGGIWPPDGTVYSDAKAKPGMATTLAIGEEGGLPTDLLI